jgi:hypothetical protein
MSSNIDNQLKPLSPDYVGAYLGTGIQLYNLLEWALKQTGKADITVLTFSISEEFIRKVWQLKEKGLIQNITVILDFKAIQKTHTKSCDLQEMFLQKCIMPKPMQNWF